MRDDVPAFAGVQKVRDSIVELGKPSYVAQTNGFWYEYSLAVPSAFGIDIAKKEATFFDDGKTKISVSTLPQSGRGVAAMLSLPIKSESGPCIEKYRDKNYFINSFTINQRDMLDSLLRVTGDKEQDWKITKEPARERFAQAQKDFAGGDFKAFAKVMYSRIFFDDGVGNFEAAGKLANAELGLPKDDLDAATKDAIERSKHNVWH